MTAKATTVKVTHRYNKDNVLAVVTLVPTDNHFDRKGESYDVMQDGVRIGGVESYFEARMYSIANSRLGRYGATRKWWSGRDARHKSVHYEGQTSRMETLRSLVNAHATFTARVEAPLTDRDTTVLADITAQGHSRVYGASEYAIPVLLAKGLIVRLPAGQTNANGTARVFETVGA